MPKKNKKSGRSGGASGEERPGVGRRGKPREVSEDRLSDAASEMTHFSLEGGDSDLDSLGTVAKLEMEEEGADSEAVIERKLSEALENASHKNSSVRLAALKILTGVLSRFSVPALVGRQAFTVADAAERALRKGSGEEATLGARLSALLAVQLGLPFLAHYGAHRSLLRQHLNNPSAAAAFRATCAEVLSLCGVLIEEDAEEIQRNIELFRSIWAAFRPAAHAAASSDLFAAALQGWALHLALLSPRHRLQVLGADLAKVTSYLDASQMEIRLEAGEATALLYEVALDADGDFRPPGHQHSMATLDMLATDPERHRGKKDRRLQRSTFRQILAFVGEGEMPAWRVRFQGETLELGSWQERVLYECLCSLLRGGLFFQLRSNGLLRDLFDLGAPPDLTALANAQRLSKAETMSAHARATKFRKQCRGRQRDKKASAQEID